MPAVPSRRNRNWSRWIANFVIFGAIAGVLSACYVYPAPPPRPHYYYYGGYYYR
ncbi:hypothetical protein GCM10011611_31980 [Aliidongia dinghuensis]|uniref:Lipoprotein n=1 Tax=Aliidongia dinghuensis TaxID=1867774 RepID=A0A8J2YUM7_9PROT|nr:hypothetical protein GCM10011611_31980 [Aliidongia dinghuensis]